MKNNKFIIFIVLLSFFFSNFYIELGFALKPFMILTFIISLIYISKFKLYKPTEWEMFLYIFYVYFMFTVIIADYPINSLRLIAGILIMFYTYSILKIFIENISIYDFEKIIGRIGIIVNISSIFLFVMGIVSVGFNFHNNGFRSYGLLLDRGLPRLIGIFNDPNIYVYFNSIFFFYYLVNLNQNKINKLGLILTILSIILTFSRGAILGIVCSIIVYFMFYINYKNLVKLIITLPILTYSLNWIVLNLFHINIVETMINRITALSFDNGSGRYTLWTHGINYFLENPLFGIGIYNFKSYELSKYGVEGHLHNTYLDILVEGGLIGILLYLVFILFFIRKLYKMLIINKRSGYLLLTYISWLVMMSGLSLIIAEAFFVLLLIVWKYSLENKKKVGNINDKYNYSYIRK